MSPGPGEKGHTNKGLLHTSEPNRVEEQISPMNNLKGMQ